MSIFCSNAGVPSLPEGGDADRGGPGGDGDGKKKGEGVVLAAPSVTVTWGRQSSAHRPDFFAWRGTVSEQMSRVSRIIRTSRGAGACYRALRKYCCSEHSYILAAWYSYSCSYSYKYEVYISYSFSHFVRTYIVRAVVRVLKEFDRVQYVDWIVQLQCMVGKRAIR